MSYPPSLMTMCFNAWGKYLMMMFPAPPKVRKPEAVFGEIEDYTIKRISNAAYEDMTTEEKLIIQDRYRMIMLDDPDFYGFWMLVPKGIDE